MRRRMPWTPKSLGVPTMAAPEMMLPDSIDRYARRNGLSGEVSQFAQYRPAAVVCASCLIGIGASRSLDCRRKTRERLHAMPAFTSPLFQQETWVGQRRQFRHPHGGAGKSGGLRAAKDSICFVQRFPRARASGSSLDISSFGDRNLLADHVSSLRLKGSALFWRRQVGVLIFLRKRDIRLLPAFSRFSFRVRPLFAGPRRSFVPIPVGPGYGGAL